MTLATFRARAGGGPSGRLKSRLPFPDFTPALAGSANLCQNHRFSFFGRSQNFHLTTRVGPHRPSLVGGTDRTSNVTTVQPGSDDLSRGAGNQGGTGRPSEVTSDVRPHVGVGGCGSPREAEISANDAPSRRASPWIGQSLSLTKVKSQRARRRPLTFAEIGARVDAVGSEGLKSGHASSYIPVVRARSEDLG